jgi:hypothetical protein
MRRVAHLKTRGQEHGGRARCGPGEMPPRRPLCDVPTGAEEVQV